tara:strand:+ start:139 stop:351 length:213 start_codon:yes stop_codon:yes gene_type:complete
LYREPHLNEKNAECAALWYEWFSLFDDIETRNTEETKELRKKWCKCCTEFGEMISQEVKTNTRYNNMRKT